MMHFRLFTLLLLGSLLCTCGRAQEKEVVANEAKPPNVLFLAVDDLRPELRAYGKGYIHSPNIDRLAASGMFFKNAYCNVPVCGASRASIMTGMRPTRDRFWDYKCWISEDVPEAITLHGHFKANGYYTAAMGKILHHAKDRAGDYHEPNWRPGVGGGAGRDYQMPDNIAKATAKKIGKVDVEMGETSCKVPLATDYIVKIESAGRIGKKKKSTKC
ncbi:MAG: sulfatase-like hydrolase/transferase [Bacteroidota bacterium]